MSGIFHILNIGSESLHATRQGVDTAGHNIANAQVEGYSRQRVNIAQREPLQKNNILIGNGVYVGNVSRSHDKFVENQINKAHQNLGYSNARSESLKALEMVYSPELNASVADEMTKFFNSLEDLSNFPEDFTVRTSVVESGKDIASAFRRVDEELNINRSGLNERVAELCSDVTQKCEEIASLNLKIQGLEVGSQGQQANDLRDQRDRLLRDITEKVEIKYYEDQHGMLLVRGPNQVTLVEGGHSAKLGVQRSHENNGMYDVTITDWENNGTRVVTDKMDGGSLQALIQVRDRDIPDLRGKNNYMAREFAGNFNQIHRNGFGVKDYAEKTGRDFFAISGDADLSASSIWVDDSILQSNDAISAASSPMAPGDNINVNGLLSLKNAKLFGDDLVNLNEFYANYAGALGLDVVRASHIKDANSIVVDDLTARREAVAGVSLDEEATNMLKWQANFTASSKVITTADEMLETVLSLKR
jgi:flagellar hook-associated protein 1 FlgK